MTIDLDRLRRIAKNGLVDGADVLELIDALDRVRALAERWRASETLGAASIMVRAAIDGTEPS